eukprot:622258-Prymnesium_polylepis.1
MRAPSAGLTFSRAPIAPQDTSWMLPWPLPSRYQTSSRTIRRSRRAFPSSMALMSSLLNLWPDALLA